MRISFSNLLTMWLMQHRAEALRRLGMHGRRFWAPPKERDDGSIRWRVVALRTGHTVALGRSMDIAVAYAEGVGMVLDEDDPREWVVNLDAPDMVAWVRVHDGIALLGVASPTARCSIRKNSRPLVEHLGRTTLRRSVCEMLLSLAGADRSSIVLDPLCGVGSIPVAAARGGRAGLALGADLGAEETQKCRRNDPDGSFGDWLRWDSRRIVLRRGVVDVICTDMPFGRRCGSRAGAARLVAAFMHSVGRVLVPGGRAAIMVAHKKGFEAALNTVPSLDRVSEVSIALGGMPVVIYVLMRR